MKIEKNLPFPKEGGIRKLPRQKITLLPKTICETWSLETTDSRRLRNCYKGNSASGFWWRNM